MYHDHLKPPVRIRGSHTRLRARRRCDAGADQPAPEEYEDAATFPGEKTSQTLRGLTSTNGAPPPDTGPRE